MPALAPLGLILTVMLGINANLASDAGIIFMPVIAAASGDCAANFFII